MRGVATRLLCLPAFPGEQRPVIKSDGWLRLLNMFGRMEHAHMHTYTHAHKRKDVHTKPCSHSHAQTCTHKCTHTRALHAQHELHLGEAEAGRVTAAHEAWVAHRDARSEAAQLKLIKAQQPRAQPVVGGAAGVRAAAEAEAEAQAALLLATQVSGVGQVARQGGPVSWPAGGGEGRAFLQMQRQALKHFGVACLGLCAGFPMCLCVPPCGHRHSQAAKRARAASSTAWRGKACCMKGRTFASATEQSPPSGCPGARLPCVHWPYLCAGEGWSCPCRRQQGPAPKPSAKAPEQRALQRCVQWAYAFVCVQPGGCACKGPTCLCGQQAHTSVCASRGWG